MIFDLLLSFVLSYLMTSIALRLFIKQQTASIEEQTLPIPTIPKDWKVPLFIEHTPDKSMYYAWDVSGTFVGQHPDQEQLLTFVSERYNIPKERLLIEEIKSL